MEKCRDCGEQSIECIDNNGEYETVCTSCGLVQERGSLASDAASTPFISTNKNSLFPSQAVPMSIRQQSIPFTAEGLKVGRCKITELASTFRLSPDMTHNVHALFGAALKNQSLLHWSLKKKTILAGCCLYIVLRQHNWPVTVSNVCNALGCCRSEFASPYTKLLAFFNLSISMPCIEDLMEGFINECKKLEETEKAVLLERSLKILQIAKDCWLTSGRMPRPFLLASVYLSWQSLKPSRSKVTMNTFCRQMGLTVQIWANFRKNEFFETLCKLGNKLPWFEDQKITVKNLCLHLEDILKYSRTLILDCAPDDKTFRKCSKKKTSRSLPNVELPPDSRKTVEVLSDDDLGECEDIFDEEIDSYIRTEKEVEFIRKMNSTFSTDTEIK